MKKYFLLFHLSVFLLFYFFLFTLAARAADLNPPPAQIGDFEKIFTAALKMVTTVALIAVFIMLLFGGFKYLTAGGDPKANESAKNTITYAVLGLVLTLGAWFILQFVKFFTGAPVTNFSILFPGS